jgi:alpha-ketoglutarate-dependent taurine dioxygenase
MRIREISDVVGAFVEDVDLTRKLPASAYGELRDALVKYGVLIFRGQQIDDRQQIEFSRGFGPLEVFVNADIVDKDLPEIMEVADVGDTTKYVSIAQLWHTDGSYRETPAYVTTLRALAISPEGGETCFANACAAYEALPDDRKQALEGVEAIHDLDHSRSLVEGMRPFTAEEKARIPATAHPIVRLHPDSGRKMLYLANHIREVAGMALDEGRALVRELTDWATQDRFVYEHSWQPGDLVIWDNRTVLHRVKPYDATRHKRVMHRTEVCGLAA